VEVESAAERIEDLQDEAQLKTMVAASDFLSQFKGMADVRVKVLRRSADTGRWEYVKTFAPDVVDSDYIRNHFGPGQYKLTVLGPKNNIAPSGYYGQHVEDIADLGKGMPAEQPRDSTPDSFKMMMGMMMAHTATLEKILVAAIAGKQNDADPTRIMEVASSIAEKMSGARAPTVFDPDKQLAMLMTWYDKGFERGTESNAESDPYKSVIEGLGIPLVQALTMRPPQGGPPQLRQPSPPKEIPAMSSTAPLWMATLQQHFPTLLMLARSGTSPSLVAEMVAEHLTDDAEDKIRGDCIAPDWEAQTMAHLPQPFQVQFGSWTRAVLTELKALLTEEDEQPQIEVGTVEGDEEASS
jgi:hypothetical protein